MKFLVSVTRTCWAETQFEVDADDLSEAENKALDMAGNHEFGSGNADYEVSGSKPIREGER